MARRPLNQITDDRAARRFHQIAVLEQQLTIKRSDLAAAKAHVKELQTEADGVLARLRAAARDDGELPLFDLDES
jgi:hypothetical protein